RNRSRSIGIAGHLASESPVTFNRNPRSRYPGIAGHVRSEYAVILVRNTQSGTLWALGASDLAATHARLARTARCRARDLLRAVAPAGTPGVVGLHRGR